MGRKGLRVTGPMITNIEEGSFPLILERGAFSWPGTRSRGLRIGGGVSRRASPNFSRKQWRARAQRAL